MAITIKRAALAALLLCAGPSWAQADLPLNENFKRDILTFCQNKPASQKASCVHTMADKYAELKQASMRGDRQSSIQLCLHYGSQSPAGLAASLICTSDVFAAQRSTHYKQIAHYPYIKNRMRPYWASRCAKSYGADINLCLKKEEGAFAVFWDKYSQQVKPSTTMDKCLARLNPGWNFPAVNQCNMNIVHP